MKITISFCSPVQIKRDETDLAISKTIRAVEAENGPSRFAVAAARTKGKLATGLRKLAAELATEEGSSRG